MKPIMTLTLGAILAASTAQAALVVETTPERVEAPEIHIEVAQSSGGFWSWLTVSASSDNYDRWDDQDDRYEAGYDDDEDYDDDNDDDYDDDDYDDYDDD